MQYYQIKNKRLNEIYRYSKIKKELKENGREKNRASGSIQDTNQDMGQGREKTT